MPPQMSAQRRIVFLSVSLLLGTSGVFAQGVDGAAVLRRLDVLELAVRAIEKQLVELNTLVRSTGTPASPIENIPPVALNMANASIQGSENARIVLIEYSDFQCPFCRQHAEGVYTELTRKFVQTGKVKYVFRHFPIERLHPLAMKAAEAAECAREQNKFWEMHDQLFANQHALAASDLHRYAQNLGLDRSRFESCLTEGRTAPRVRHDFAEGQGLGVTGTPSFFLGEIDAEGAVQVTRKIVGTQSFAVFHSALQAISESSSAGVK